MKKEQSFRYLSTIAIEKVQECKIELIVRQSSILTASYLILLFRYTSIDRIILECKMNGTESLIAFFERKVINSRSLFQLIKEIDEKKFEIDNDNLENIDRLCSAYLDLHNEIGYKVEGQMDFNLTLTLENDFKIKFNYTSHLFPFDIRDQFIKHLLQFLINININLQMKIINISILSPEDISMQYDQFNYQNKSWEEELLHSYPLLFEKRVLQSGDKIALKYDKETLTYQQLNLAANQMGRLFKKCGIKPGDRIALCMPRSPSMVISILAIWKVGAIYLPLDPDYPFARLKIIIDDCSPVLILTKDVNITELEKIHFKILDITDVEIEVRDFSDINLEWRGDSHQLAYLIYTSGSTGSPKGVMISHGGMINHLFVKISDLNMNSDTKIAQTASHCFDISIWQFFSSLLVGGSVVIYKNNTVRNVNLLTNSIHIDEITIIEFVPSFLSIMLDWLNKRNKRFSNLQFVLVTGESVSPSIVHRWYSLYSNIQLINVYGPTEVSDDITHYFFNPEQKYETVPIGKPVANMNISVIDSDWNPCPIGVKGEIVVTGVGVGNGYWNKPEKTQEHFVEEKVIGTLEVKRYYCTGDIGYWDNSGKLYCYGRKDDQVKVKGHRIELSEIDNIISLHLAVKLALTIILENNSYENAKELKTYIQLNDSYKGVEVSEIKKMVLDNLPSYMVPSEIIILDKFPLNSNGKIDKKCLLQNEKT